VASHLEALSFCRVLPTFGNLFWQPMVAFWNVIVADLHEALFKNDALPVDIHYKSAAQLQQFYLQAKPILVLQVKQRSTAARPAGSQLTMVEALQRGLAAAQQQQPPAK
jgi:hypothetical protein